MTKLRICWLAPYSIDLMLPEIKVTQNIGMGYTRWLANLAEVISKRDDIELHIITYAAKIPFDQYILKNNLHFHVLRHSFIKDKGYPSYLPLDVITWYYSLVKKILKKVEEINPDLVHAHGTEGVFSLAALKTKLPTITSIQGIITEYAKGNFSLYYIFQQLIEKYCIKKNKYFGYRTNWDSSFIKSINKNPTLCYSPEAISYVFFKEQWQGYKNINQLIFVGNIIKRKGIETLIEAVYKLLKYNNKIKVIIIGNGPRIYVDYLKTIIADLQMDNKFEFKGSLKSIQIAEELCKSGIYILPTKMDNSPNSLCEAMAVGMPTIASNVGGIPSLIENGKNGLLFEVGNSDDLCTKINQLQNDIEYAIAIGKNASKEAFNRNYPDSVAKTTLEIYRNIIKNDKVIFK